MEELELPELTTEQLEVLCSNAEDSARKYVLSKVPLKDLERLDVTVEAEGSKPLNLSIDVDLSLSTRTKEIEPRSLAEEATRAALKAAETFLRKLK